MKLNFIFAALLLALVGHAVAQNGVAPITVKVTTLVTITSCAPSKSCARRTPSEVLFEGTEKPRILPGSQSSNSESSKYGSSINFSTSSARVMVSASQVIHSLVNKSKVKAQRCNHDNCLRQFIRSSNIFTGFCHTYTTTVNEDASTTLASQCEGLTSRVSSACTCLMSSSSSFSSLPPATENGVSQSLTLAHSEPLSMSTTPQTTADVVPIASSATTQNNSKAGSDKPASTNSKTPDGPAPSKSVFSNDFSKAENTVSSHTVSLDPSAGGSSFSASFPPIEQSSLVVLTTTLTGLGSSGPYTVTVQQTTQIWNTLPISTQQRNSESRTGSTPLSKVSSVIPTPIVESSLTSNIVESSVINGLPPPIVQSLPLVFITTRTGVGPNGPYTETIQQTALVLKSVSAPNQQQSQSAGVTPVDLTKDAPQPSNIGNTPAPSLFTFQGLDPAGIPFTTVIPGTVQSGAPGESASVLLPSSVLAFTSTGVNSVGSAFTGVVQGTLLPAASSITSPPLVFSFTSTGNGPNGFFTTIMQATMLPTAVGSLPIPFTNPSMTTIGTLSKGSLFTSVIQVTPNTAQTPVLSDVPIVFSFTTIGTNRQGPFTSVIQATFTPQPPAVTSEPPKSTTLPPIVFTYTSTGTSSGKPFETVIIGSFQPTTTQGTGPTTIPIVPTQTQNKKVPIPTLVVPPPIGEPPENRPPPPPPPPKEDPPNKDDPDGDKGDPPPPPPLPKDDPPSKDNPGRNKGDPPPPPPPPKDNYPTKDDPKEKPPPPPPPPPGNPPTTAPPSSTPTSCVTATATSCSLSVYYQVSEGVTTKTLTSSSCQTVTACSATGTTQTTTTTSSSSATPTFYMIQPNYKASYEVLKGFTAQLIQETDPKTLWVSEAPAANFIAFWYQKLNVTQIEYYKKNPAVGAIINEVVADKDSGVRRDFFFTEDRKVNRKRKVSNVTANLSNREVTIPLSSLLQEMDPPSALKVVSQPPGIKLNDINSYAYQQEQAGKVRVYLIDAGAYVESASYKELSQAGRFDWIWPGPNVPIVGLPFNHEIGEKTDRGLHGTCMVSKIVSAEYGVSKAAAITMVRLPSCSPGVGEDPARLPGFRASVFLDGLTQILQDVMIRKLEGRAVVNLSLGGGVRKMPVEGDEDFPSFKVIERLIEQKVIVVAATGNSGAYTKNLNAAPAIFNHLTPIITVSAVDDNGLIAFDAQYLPSPEFPQASVDVWAPGHQIECDRQLLAGGSSPATASVSGLIAYFLATPGHFDKIDENFKVTLETGEDWSEAVKDYVKKKAWARIWNEVEAKVIWNGEVPLLKNDRNEKIYACPVHPGFEKRNGECPKPKAPTVTMATQVLGWTTLVSPVPITTEAPSKTKQNPTTTSQAGHATCTATLEKSTTVTIDLWTDFLTTVDDEKKLQQGIESGCPSVSEWKSISETTRFSEWASYRPHYAAVIWRSSKKFSFKAVFPKKETETIRCIQRAVEAAGGHKDTGKCAYVNPELLLRDP